MAITKEQVFEAADSLAQNGSEPTYLQVRMHLGSGSFSTIQKYLRLWREARDESGGSGANESELPELLVTASRGFAREVWRVAQSSMARKTAALREELESHHAGTLQDLEAASQMVDTLQGKLEEVRAELARAREEVVMVETRRLSAEAAKARAVTDYEHAARLLGEAKRELDERTQIIANLRGTIAEQEQSNREAVANHSATVERLLQEQAALRGENTIARERIEELQGSTLSSQGEREGLQREVTLLREHIAHERTRYTELTTQLGQLSHMLSPQLAPASIATTATDRVPTLAVAGHRGG